MTRRKVVLASTAAVTVGVLVVALLLFQPWKLFVDTRVDEALPEALSSSDVGPTAVPTPTASETLTSAPAAPTSTPVATAPVTLGRGAFRSFEHRTTGTALVLRLPDGRVVVRLQDLVTSDGPDVHVWLSKAPATAAPESFPPGHLELGRLKGNLGNQNYAVPRGVDAASYGAVVIWCERFAVAFGAATIH